MEISIMNEAQEEQAKPEEKLEHYWGLAGLDFARRWTDGLIAVLENWLVTISAVLLTVGIGVAMYDFFSAGSAFQNDLVRNAWAIVQTLAVDSQFLLMWYRCKIEIQAGRYGRAAGYALLGSGLALVTFGTNAIPSLQLARGHGFTFEQATNEIGIDPIALVYVRTVVLVILAILAAFNREAIDFRSGSKVAHIKATKLQKIKPVKAKKVKPAREKKERRSWFKIFSKKAKTIDPQTPDLAKNVTETQTSEIADVAQNLSAQEVEISPETTPTSEYDLGLNGNIHHEVNYPQTNPKTPEPETLDFTLNANQFYDYEVENHAPDLAEMKQETQAPQEVYKDVVFEDLYAETAPAEEPEEEPATEPLERAETSEEQAQTKRRDTGSFKRASTSAQKAVLSGKKYASAEEIAELPEVSKALGFTGRGAPLRRLQAVNDAIQRKEIKWYGGGYSHSAVIKWLDSQKVREENAV